ncbi:MAG TPA: sulfatase-like hydrolase/transferase [Bacteroidia bacterium]|mgnify:CR=1 FL=1|nr:sulfatase-like hydrolase/transferase [Bacteroidia bacterium]
MKNLICILCLIFLPKFLLAQRNVVLIIADDLGTDYCGFYEDYADTANLPNIRALLSRSVRFKNAMASPVCSSTRAGMLTGRYSFRTGVGNIVGSTAGSGQLDTSEFTIPRMLKNYNSNIKCANIGKWHLNQPNPTSNLLIPNIVGYDHFEGPFIGQIPSYTNWTKYTNGVASTITTYATTETVNNSVSWLRNNNGQPIFLWMAFNAPHSPYHLPPAGMYSNTTLSGTTFDINQHPKDYFIADLEALDFELGRFMDSLTVLNLVDSTDFIFMGDNGNASRVAQNFDTLRAKGTIYQYGVHVPFFIAGPDVVNPGRSSDALVNTHDLFATIIEMFGNANWQTSIPPNKPVDSRSVLPILKNQVNQVRDWSFAEMFKLIPDSADGKAMRNADYKLLSFDDGHQEFYNLTNDYNENSNLLNGNLSSIELSNYNYLCNEMTTLVGGSSYCTSTGVLNVNAPETNGLFYPNPFTNNLKLNAPLHNINVEMFDFCGRIVYSGTNIESIDFSFLEQGVYFVRVNNITQRLVKF